MADELLGIGTGFFTSGAFGAFPEYRANSEAGDFWGVRDREGDGIKHI